MKKLILIAMLMLAMSITASAQSSYDPIAVESDEVEMQMLFNRPWENSRAQAYYGIVVKCREWITLRDEPSVYGADLAHIPLGAEVIVYDGPPQNGFFAVKYNGICGFALAEYIRGTRAA